jgi:hypothetical protein
MLIDIYDVITDKPVSEYGFGGLSFLTAPNLSFQRFPKRLNDRVSLLFGHLRMALVKRGAEIRVIDPLNAVYT